MQKSVLVVKKAADEAVRQENQKIVEAAIMENEVEVVESYENKSGDLTVVCETEEKRNELKDLVALKSQEIVITTPREMRHSVTIVGLRTEYDKEEITEMLSKQNSFIRKFAQNNNLEDHVTVHIVKPLKNDETRYQAFCDVSSTLREVFSHYNDKITVGLKTCKVYDRYNIKRCYKCQEFGHYARECVHETPVCGKCGEEHNTRECESTYNKCVNCVRSECDDCLHSTSSIECPQLIEQQEKLKKKLDNARLNLSLLEVQPQR